MPTMNNKRNLSSSTSSRTCSSSLETSTLEYPVFKEKKKKKKKKTNISMSLDQQRKMDEFVKSDSNEGSKGASASCLDVIKKQLADISEKLSTVLTKDDKRFLRDIIQETVNGMKDDIVSSVKKHIEKLESDIFDQTKEIESLRKDIRDKDEKIKTVEQNVKCQENQLKKQDNVYKEHNNELEQYSRRNNIKIYGLKGDHVAESSQAAADLAVKEINSKTGLKIDKMDIDVAHRLGKYQDGKHRAVIVKFVRREQKFNVMRNAKKFKDTGIFVNEDLTKLNAEVLASLRLKDKSNVDRAWSFEGKLYALYKGKERGERIYFEQYNTWLTMPWPIKSRG